MTEYWKSTEKKYCDICKCWITGSTMSIQVHESGVRHKMNAQEKLREIQKKAKSNDKEVKNLAKSLRRIEEAASAAVALDKEANPDMSLKIQSYMEFLKEKEVEIGGGQKEEPKLEAPKVKILHREEKDNNDSLELPTPRPYMNRFGGWTSVDSKGPKLDFELPSSSYSVTAGKSKKKKSSTTTCSSTITFPPQHYTVKVKEKPKHVFVEKTVPISTTSMSSDSGRIKTEPGVESSEVVFKKRKFSRPNARQALD